MDKSAMLNIVKFLQKTQVKKKFNIHEVSKKILLRPPSIQIELDSSRCFFFMDTILVVGSLGQAKCLGTLIEMDNLDTFKIFLFHFSDMTTHNPWQVDSVQEFWVLKCPECIFDTKDEEYF